MFILVSAAASCCFAFGNDCDLVLKCIINDDEFKKVFEYNYKLIMID